MQAGSDSASSIYSSDEYGSSGNEADSEREEVLSRKDMNDVINKLKNFSPYMYEPEKEVSSTSESSSGESDASVSYSPDADALGRVGNLDWCKCKNCKLETREIDCICCQEVDAY